MPKALGLCGLAYGLLLIQEIWLSLVLLLVLKTLIPAPHLVVSDQRRDMALLELGDIGIAVVA